MEITTNPEAKMDRYQAQKDENSSDWLVIDTTTGQVKVRIGRKGLSAQSRESQALNRAQDYNRGWIA